MSAPLTQLLKDDHPARKDFESGWGPEQERAFLTLREKLASPPILKLCDPRLPFLLRTDASEWGLGAELLQLHEDGEWYPIEYRSVKLSPPQMRWAAHEREVCALLFALESFGPYLRGLSHFVAETDNLALSYIMKSQDLCSKFARWVTKLADFPGMEIRHRPGKLMVIPDACSRFPSDHPSVQSGFDPDEFCGIKTVQALAELCSIVDGAQSAELESQEAPAGAEDDQASEPTARLPPTGPFSRDYVATDRASFNIGAALRAECYQQLAMTRGRVMDSVRGENRETAEFRTLASAAGWSTITDEVRKEMTTSQFRSPNHKKWEDWYKACEELSELRNEGKGTATSTRVYDVIDGRLFMHDRDNNTHYRLVVPKEDRPLYLQQVHDAVMCGHQGRIRTMNRAMQSLWWPGMDKDVEEYVRSCDTCQKMKALRQAPAGTAKPLPAPYQPWQQIGIDFIGPLRVSEGVDTIMVVVCHLTGMTHLVPCKGTDDAPAVAKRFLSDHGNR